MTTQPISKAKAEAIKMVTKISYTLVVLLLLLLVIGWNNIGTM